MKNNLEEIFLQLKTQLNIETIKTKMSYSGDYPYILPDTCIDYIKKQQEGKTKIYFFEIPSGYKGLLVSNKINTFLAMGQDIFYFDSEFNNYSKIIRIINGNHYSDNSIRFASLFINNSRIESSDYLAINLNNQYIKRTEILINSKEVNDFQFFSASTNVNKLHTVSFDYLRKNIKAVFQDCFIKDLTLNLDLKITNVRFSDNIVKDLGISADYYSTNSYKEIVSLLKEPRDLHFLSLDKKYPVMTKKLFDLQISQIELVVRNRIALVNLNISQLYDSIIEPFNLVKNYILNEDSGLVINAHDKEILNKYNKAHENDFTMIKIALLQTFGSINIISPKTIKSLNILKNKFDDLNEDFITIVEKNKKEKSLKIK